MLDYKQAVKKTGNSFKKMSPVLVGVILLVSLANALIPKSFYAKAFSGNYIMDSILGAVVGSLAAGNPTSSYVIGGELLQQGVSLLAVTAFIVAWVTVGVVQLPAEALMLGKKFAVIRNLVCFIMAIMLAVLTVLFINIL